MGHPQVRIIHDFTVIDCYKCGVLFAVEESINERWLAKGESFYCPNGHSQHYTTSKIQKLEKELKQVKKNLEWAQTDINNAHEENAHLRHTVRAEKGAKTKLKKRIANGVCPCCNRNFKNLRRHMDGQHPEYGGTQ